MNRHTAEAIRRINDRTSPGEQAADRRILHATRSPGTPPISIAKENAAASFAARLEEAGHEVIIRNGGLHLQIKVGQGTVDIWPTVGAGKWRFAASGRSGIGFTALVAALGKS